MNPSDSSLITPLHAHDFHCRTASGTVHQQRFRKHRPLLLLLVLALLAGCNSSGSSSSDDESRDDAESQTFYAAKGPYQEGSTISFHELNPDTGLRQGSAVAEVEVGDLGDYAFPQLSGRWYEAEIEGDFFDEYEGEFTDNGGLKTTSILDLDSTSDGRNINLFTHLVSARAQKLLTEGAAQDLEEAYTDATKDLKDDFNLKHPPQDLHPFYTSGMDSERLDDYAALLIASAQVSHRIEDSDQFEAFVSAYASERTESSNEHMEGLVSTFQDGGSFLLNRALSNLSALEEDKTGEPPSDRLSLGWILSGCAAAQAFNVDPVMCLDGVRATYKYSIPPGDGDYIKEIYYLPSLAGMWALEVAHDESCLTFWSTTTADGHSVPGSGSGYYNRRVNHRLLATVRIAPRMYQLSVWVDRDDCSASETELNFRRVAEGRLHVNPRGNIFLENEKTHQGVVGAYRSTLGSLERSSSRSYYYFVAPSNAGTYRLELDYSSSNSTAMATRVQYLSDSGFNADDFLSHSTDLISEVSGETQVREFETTAGTVYQIEVHNTIPSTINLGDSISYQRLPFELTLTRQ